MRVIKFRNSIYLLADNTEIKAEYSGMSELEVIDVDKLYQTEQEALEILNRNNNVTLEQIKIIKSSINGTLDEWAVKGNIITRMLKGLEVKRWREKMSELL